ncbi:hypothetical protein I308_104871 [Cryptococcus tetragattii IND107]|uniref:Uncharacterized protein n=1 Tax=Cryptococcus tetragattii IND107 TaxID=1296105 RepID=A0ABR3BPP0_9TREE
MTAPFTVTFDAKHGLQLDAYLPTISIHRSCQVHDMIEDVRSLFAYIASAETELSSVLYSNGLSADTSRIVVVGVSGGNYPARAAATLSSIVPRPIGWLNLSGMGSDWLLNFWINGIDVERTMPLDTTVHDMAKADELMKTGGGAVVSAVESVLVDGKATDELGRFNLWIAWQKWGIFLDYVLSEPGLSARLAQVPYQSRLQMIPKKKRRLLLPITPGTPPTYVLHGKEDLLVPFEESLTLEMT